MITIYINIYIMSLNPPSFLKLSLVTLAILQVQLAQAQDTTLPVIQLQAEDSEGQSSEKTRSYIIKKAVVQPS